MPAAKVPGLAALQTLAPGVGLIGAPGVKSVPVAVDVDVADQASSFTTSESGNSLVRLLTLFARTERLINPFGVTSHAQQACNSSLGSKK